MAVQELVERVHVGASGDGTPVYHRNFTGRPDVRSMGDWAEVMRVRLRINPNLPLSPADVVLTRMLTELAAGRDGLALIREGKSLDPAGRWRVGNILRIWAEMADGVYEKAYVPVKTLRRQWTGKWGDQAPRPPRQLSTAEVAVRQYQEALEARKAREAAAVPPPSAEQQAAALVKAYTR